MKGVFRDEDICSNPQLKRLNKHSSFFGSTVIAHSVEKQSIRFYTVGLVDFLQREVYESSRRTEMSVFF